MVFSLTIKTYHMYTCTNKKELSSLIAKNAKTKLVTSSRPGSIDLSLACCSAGNAAIESRQVKGLMNKIIVNR